jgi:hypothetical protein
MAHDEITVLYHEGDNRLKARIYLSRNDVALVEVTKERINVDEDVDWVELTISDVTPTAFGELLKANARASDAMSLWCYRPVWLALLELLDVRPPLPATVQWPKDKSR